MFYPDLGAVYLPIRARSAKNVGKQVGMCKGLPLTITTDRRSTGQERESLGTVGHGKCFHLQSSFLLYLE